MDDSIIESGTDRIGTIVPTVFESPFAAEDLEVFCRNIAYARLLIRDGGLRYNEAGLPSHIVWTQPGVTIPEERAFGIDCGLAIADLNGWKHIYGTDLDWSPGMIRSWDRSVANKREVFTRSLSEELGEKEFNRQLEEILEWTRRDAAVWHEWAGFAK